MSLLKKIKLFFSKKEEPMTKPVVTTIKKKQLSKAEIQAKQERANQLLKEELAKEKTQQTKKETNSMINKKIVNQLEIEEKEKSTKLNRKQRITISEKEQEAKSLATDQNTVLFIQATTKRLRAIEWRNSKKRIILSKEREIRRTHKGGFSQEKFQAFVDSQIAKTPDWVESNLKKPGVLRGPYDEVIIEADEKVREVIEKIF